MNDKTLRFCVPKSLTICEFLKFQLVLFQTHVLKREKGCKEKILSLISTI